MEREELKSKLKWNRKGGRLNQQRMGNKQDDPSRLAGSLAQRWARRHAAFERYTLAWRTSFALARCLVSSPFTWQGRVVRFLTIVLGILGLPLAMTAVQGQWEKAPMFVWVAVAVAFGFANLAYPWYKKAAQGVVALYLTIRDEGHMSGQMQWDRRWFSLHNVSLSGIMLSAIVLVALYMTHQRLDANLAIGTFFIVAVLSYQLGENTYIALMMCLEAYRLSAYDYDLYCLSPIDTIQVRQAAKAYNQLGLLDSLVITMFIVSIAALLPDPAYLLSPTMLAVWFVVYFVIVLEVFVPRSQIQRIVRRSKVRELAPLQKRLNDLLSDLPHLTSEQYRELERLQDVHRTIRHSPERLFSSGGVGKVAGTLLLPLITFMISVVSETYLSMVLEPFFR